MSDNSLPDEIISEILSPALKVSDEAFSDISHVSPFSDYSESTSAYLLVCKSWLRVATPLLYNVVILRSKAQAKALGQALSENKDLGQFIRKLRVEGGYGAPMNTILRCSLNISDLFLSLEIFASDSTVGLCKGLPVINPTRLIVRARPYKKSENKMASKLVDALAQSILKWDRLVTFHCPGATDRYRTTIYHCLAKSKRLHTIVVPNADSAFWAFRTFDKCPLKVIQIEWPVPEDYLEKLPLDDPTFAALVRFTREEDVARTVPVPVLAQVGSVDMPPCLSPSFIPMEAESQAVKDVVWKRVLYFAMSVPELEHNLVRKKIPPRLPVLLVSKTFNRLALPYYYAHLTLRNLAAAEKLAAVLEKNPSLGPHIRTVWGELGVMDWLYSEDSQSEADPVPISSGHDWAADILSQTTGLVNLGNNPPYNRSLLRMPRGISWDAFAVAAKCSGSTLQHFSACLLKRDKASPAIFAHLNQLRLFDWTSLTIFDLIHDIPSDALSNLIDLRISCAHPSFIEALSQMKLPSLQRLLLNSRHEAAVVNFLRVHGGKLTELEYSCYNAALAAEMIRICPNLTLLSFNYEGGSGDPPEFSSQNTVAHSLEKIKVDSTYWFCPKKQEAKWDAFFAALKSDDFPKLREVQFNCCTWPTSERKISKSSWVRWAEGLLEHGINLTDRNGKKWRRRLR
ncbi:hypothetical protein DFH07DRAFT_334779 [Mycena maculata]|uniref:Uncharacterized protein n=1 Tax=Mycena maculata TaxID=230809 RepID=A0AAD7HDV7_9AGAR|nr:hypothetical protein DFH07DRAFT_334779 [Mycena maculata]